MIDFLRTFLSYRAPIGAISGLITHSALHYSNPEFQPILNESSPYSRPNRQIAFRGTRPNEKSSCRARFACVMSSKTTPRALDFSE